MDFGALANSEMKADIESALTQILDSEQFRRSQRSRLFLQAVVQKALSGDFASLKERIIGIELFHRDPSFDTDRDAVVRVAANDVRNRLHEYYLHSPSARITISLPAGRYVPLIEVRTESPSTTPSTTSSPARVPDQVSAQAQPESDPDLGGRKTVAPLVAPPADRAVAPAEFVGQPMAMAILAVALLVIIIGVGGIFWKMRQNPEGNVSGIAALPPWSQIIVPNKRLDLVLADANLVAATVMLNKNVSIEDYASHRFSYLPGLKTQFSAYLNEIPLTTVSDAAIATRITELATRAGGGVQIMYSNRLDVSALKGEEPLLLVGSSTSNPWVQLFNDQLNFHIEHRFDSGMDVCINRHPQPSELPTYIPVRNPAGVSEGYALIALLPNLTGKAKVLIIAGTSTEATEAAGEFVGNANELSAALKTHGIHNLHPQHLELLIKTSFVSGSAARSEVLASRVQ